MLKENRKLGRLQDKYEKSPRGCGNSSVPPSKEPVKVDIERRTKSLKKKLDKPTGGQSGQEGSTSKRVAVLYEVENLIITI